MAHNLFNTLQTFTTEKGKSGQFYSLPQLEKEGVGPVSRLPVSIRVVLESVLRTFDEKVVEESDVRALANWEPTAERNDEIPFSVARVLLQDFTGVPLLVDLAAMRSAVGSQLARARTSDSSTTFSSKLRSTDSSTTRIETGRRETGPTPSFSNCGSE